MPVKWSGFDELGGGNVVGRPVNGQRPVAANDHAPAPGGPRVPDAAAQERANLLLRYQQLFAFLPDGYVITDLWGNVRDANQAALTLLGRPREFVVGKP